jgi:hypothetical protein
MPTRIGALREKCKDWASRPSPHVSPHASDDEGEGENLWEAATGDEGGELIIVENGIGMTLV